MSNESLEERIDRILIPAVIGIGAGFGLYLQLNNWLEPGTQNSNYQNLTKPQLELVKYFTSALLGVISGVGYYKLKYNESEKRIK